MKNKILLLFVTLFSVFTASAQITIKRVAGWHESAYITWDPYPGADMYNVYVKEVSSAEWIDWIQNLSVITVITEEPIWWGLK